MKRGYYGLNICVPLNFIGGNPNVMVFGPLGVIIL